MVQRRKGADGNTLLPEVVWLDARSGVVRRSVTLRGDPTGLSYPTLSPGGTVLALDNHSSVSLWLLPSGQPWPFHLPDSPAVHSVAFDGAGRSVALGRAPGYVQLWDLHTGQRLRSFVGHGAPVSAVSLAGGRLLSAGLDGTVRVWDAATGSVLSRAQVPGTGGERAVSDVVLTPDGLTYVVLTTQGPLWLGHVGEEGLMRVDVERGRGLALNAAGNLLAVNGPSERGLALVELPSGRVRDRLGNVPGSGEGVAFAPKGDLLAEQVGNPQGSLSSDVRVIPLP